MTTMKVSAISSEVIKPAVPTPSHLRIFKRSFIDQLSLTNMMPTIFYYPPPPSPSISPPSPYDPIAANAYRILCLKQSLSRILCFYYPFAGRATHHSFIYCNDDGVEFAVTHADMSIAEVVGAKDMNVGELSKLLLYRDAKVVLPFDRILGVQANIFKCGGLAVGVKWSHLINDAYCFDNFMNSWARFARGENIVPPTVNGAVIFPPKNVPNVGTSSDDNTKNVVVVRRDGLVSKLFRFSRETISSLKDRYAKPDLIPSGFEALSTFIWTRYYESSQKQIHNQDPSEPKFLIFQQVNLRNKGDPSWMLPSCIGNVSQIAIVKPVIKESSPENGYELVRRMREGIQKLDGEYVKKLQKGYGRSLIESIREGHKEGTKMFLFSGLNKFPFYRVDFGWGKPIWVSFAYFVLVNNAVFFPTQSGDGIEVWLNLEEDDMNKIIRDHDFINSLS